MISSPGQCTQINKKKTSLREKKQCDRSENNSHLHHSRSELPEAFIFWPLQFTELCHEIEKLLQMLKGGKDIKGICRVQHALLSF